MRRAGGLTSDSYPEGAIFLRKSVAEMQKEAFERNATDLERTLLDVITNNTVPVNEFTIASINQLIEKLRQQKPLGRMVVDIDFLSLKNEVKNL